MNTFRPALTKAFEEALGYLETQESKSVSPTASLAELRGRLAKPLTEGSLPPEVVIDELAHDVQGGILASSGGRFFAWVIGGTLPAALAADWMAAAWDQSAALYAAGPAAAIVEEVAGEWLKELLRIPASASFALVTGCQMAHATCLAAARNALLSRFGWDVEKRGLFGAPRIRILSSEQLHGTFERAVQLLGLGREQIERLATGEDGRLPPDTLARALARDPESPTVVLLQAADLNIGAFDDFHELIPLAKRRENPAWVHIDGAFGLWAAASPNYAHMMEGADEADSWATDGHKWLNVPYDSGYAFIRDRDAHRNSMSHRASYMVHSDAARDQIDWTPEWSRRARGFATYAALRQLGRDGVADLVDRCCRYARRLVREIGALPGAEMLWEPSLNQGLVRFLSPTGDHDAHTDQVIQAVLETGEAFFGGTTWRGLRAMRISVCNWQTNQEDVDRTVQAFRSVLATGPDSESRK